MISNILPAWLKKHLIGWGAVAITTFIVTHYYDKIRRANSYDDRILKLEEDGMRDRLRQSSINYKDSISIDQAQKEIMEMKNRYYRDSLDRRMVLLKLNLIENVVLDMREEQKVLLKGFYKQIPMQ